MAEDNYFSGESLAEAVERACEYRRSLVDPGDGRNLGEAITGVASTAARARSSVDADGWMVAGTVFDTVADLFGRGLTVRWHPASDRIRVERPATPVYSPPPPVLWLSPFQALSTRQFEALPGHWHRKTGQLYCGDCAAAVANREGNAEGWENRPLADGESYRCVRCGADVGTAQGSLFT